ncbi:ATP-dependent DNA helicase DinG [Ammoniphilus sp. YIM 78166]|uniref:ATP-dependent DNA helicase DinG n=1 Tax=Ammoniphilus sp. YIM 78166 TaxID=1644106 RepID=UPI00142F76F3|nr:ATP-dependent DNA helicase DinG [Ammoniphilus sp. YIM 78166]
MNKFLVVDFETTGNKAKDGDQIIQIGAVLMEDGDIISQFSSLVNPGIPIPTFIQQLTQIDDEMVKDAPTIDEILPQMLPLLDGAVFVGHNVYFDLGFLQQALAEHGYLPFSGPTIDTVELSRLLLPNQTGYKLTDLALELDVEHDTPHQADSDALATAQILQSLLEKLNRLPYMVLQHLTELTKGFASDISDLIKYVEQKRLMQGSVERDEHPGLEMFRQLAVRIRGGRTEDSPAQDPAYEDFMKDIRSKLEGEMSDFEWRPAQMDMMSQVYDALSKSQHVLIEAGTGTGKSLAYLIPAFYWSKVSGEKVVISTHTIQLQEQLYTRDLPLLERIFEQGIHGALLKGRSNYLCLRKYEQSVMEPADNFDIQLSKGQMMIWLTETDTGDIEELNLPPGGQVFWRQVQSDAHSCLSNQCPWFSRCYYFAARRKAQESDVIITNHSLLLTDLKADQRILPPYRYAIIDEAHHFEEVASHHLGLSLSSIQVENYLAELGSERGMGILEKLDREWSSVPESSHEGREQLKGCINELMEGREVIREWITRLYQWGIRSGREGTEAGRLVKRFSHLDWSDKAGRDTLQSTSYVVEWLTLFQQSLEKIYIPLSADKGLPFTFRGLLTDLHGAIREGQRIRQLIQQMLLDPEVDNIHWIELDTRTNRRPVYLYRVPIDVAPLLQEQFFAEKESVVLTSATLSVNQSFAYSLKRVGLDEQQVATIQHPSPFDYRKQTLFCVPSDSPALSSGNEEHFNHYLIDSLAQLSRVTEGRMLVLFTSYQMLRQVYEPLKERLAQDGITVLGHGMDSSSRTKLTKLFKQTKKCILLGTSSFWEGVDIPGDDLSCLVIVRLPFWPPNHPVIEARSEYIKSNRGNPFMDMSVPQAVIRFKQGFGRLVRTQKDKGVVIVFDKRIVESRYGQYFVKSLPETPLHYRPFNQLLPMVEEWLG